MSMRSTHHRCLTVSLAFIRRLGRWPNWSDVIVMIYSSARKLLKSWAAVVDTSSTVRYGLSFLTAGIKSRTEEIPLNRSAFRMHGARSTALAPVTVMIRWFVSRVSLGHWATKHASRFLASAEATTHTSTLRCSEGTAHGSPLIRRQSKRPLVGKREGTRRHMKSSLAMLTLCSLLAQGFYSIGS